MNRLLAHLERTSETGKEIIWLAETDGTDLIIRYGEKGKSLKQTVIPNSRCAGNDPGNEADRRVQIKLSEDKGYVQIPTEKVKPAELSWKISDSTNVIVADPAIREYIERCAAREAFQYQDDGTIAASGFTEVGVFETMLALFAMQVNFEKTIEFSYIPEGEKNPIALNGMTYQEIVTSDTRQSGPLKRLLLNYQYEAKALGIYQEPEDLDSAFAAIATNWI